MRLTNRPGVGLGNQLHSRQRRTCSQVRFVSHVRSSVQAVQSEAMPSHGHDSRRMFLVALFLCECLPVPSIDERQPHAVMHSFFTTKHDGCHGTNLFVSLNFRGLSPIQSTIQSCPQPQNSLPDTVHTKLQTPTYMHLPRIPDLPHSRSSASSTTTHTSHGLPFQSLMFPPHSCNRAHTTHMVPSAAYLAGSTTSSSAWAEESQAPQGPKSSEAASKDSATSISDGPSPTLEPPVVKKSTPAPLSFSEVSDEAAKQLSMEEELRLAKKASRKKKKGRIRELEEIRAELAEKELVLIKKEQKLLQKEQTLSVLKEQLDLEQKLRALLTKEKEKAEEEAALAIGLCTGGAMLP